MTAFIGRSPTVPAPAPVHARAARPSSSQPLSPRPGVPWRRPAAVETGAERGAAAAPGMSCDEDADAVPVLRSAESRGQSGSGEGGTQDEHSDPPDEAGRPALDARMRYIGDTVAMVCRYEQAQCVWSARIPLHPALLPDTVLHMAYSPGLLALRFETSDWVVRDLLQSQLAILHALVEALMPATCGVAVTL